MLTSHLCLSSENFLPMVLPIFRDVVNFVLISFISLHRRCVNTLPHLLQRKMSGFDFYLQSAGPTMQAQA